MLEAHTIFFNLDVHGCFSYMHICMYTTGRQCPQKAEEGVGSPGIEVTGAVSREDAGDRTQVKWMHSQCS